MRLEKKTTATLLTAIFMISIFAVAIPVFAVTDVYVDDDASDAWYDDPTHFKTIQEGVDAVDDGGTVYVYDGTYTSTDDDVVRIGKPLTLQPAGDYYPVIQGSNVLHDKTHTAIEIGSPDDTETHHVTVKHFELRAYDDVVIIRADDVTIEGNIIRSYWDGKETPVSGVVQSPGIFACESARLTVSNNVIQKIGISDGKWAAAMFLGLECGGFHPVTDSLIEHNLIDNPSGAGILAFSTDGITIRHNTIRDVGTSTIDGYGIYAGADGKRLTIEYNEISGCTDTGIFVKDFAASHQIHYNDILDNGEYGVKNEDTEKGLDATNNWWGTNDLAIIETMVDGLVTYEPCLQGKSNAVTLEAPVVLPKVSFTVPASAVFPTIIAGGDTQSATIKITNTGDLTQKFTVTLEDDPEGFYQQCLEIDGCGYAYKLWSETSARLYPFDVELVLDVPLTRAAGTYEGTIVFWAEAVG